MAISAKTVRAQIHLLQPLLKSCSLDTIRRVQNRMGELVEVRLRKQVILKKHKFDRFDAAWILPKDQRREGVVLYLHGGGYACGDLEYAQAFGSMLAVRCGVKIFSPAYRLAPEHPFPAALEDTLESYRYLLNKGYAPEHIALFGESAGGGLCYSLCLKLKEEGLPLPGCVAAVSPWADLELSGESYRQDAGLDPSMSRELLEFYARCVNAPSEDPLASPIYGDLRGMPPSLIFVGAEELMRSDAQTLHRKLTESGSLSRLCTKADRWHAYLMYCLPEDRDDFAVLNGFFSRHLAPEDKLRWMPLDNSAKIYPAARSQTWSNVFRLSATLTEEIDREVMQSALDVTVRRFPSMAARLRRGLFWYYLEQLSEAPEIREEHSWPLTRMSREEVRRCAFRVIVYKNRVALELFHSITDGNGGLVLLKTLLAEYLLQKYGVHVPAENGVLGRLEEPSPEELEDSFLKHGGKVKASRKQRDAWRPGGTPLPEGMRRVTCMQMPVPELVSQAKSRGVTLTTYLCAAMMMALQNMQREQVCDPARRKPVKVLIPVNLRPMFGSKTLRNFVLYTTPELDPRLGDYEFDELCRLVHHHLGSEVNRKKMGMLIATNVASEANPLLKAVPLFLKNPVMKAVFDAVGERKSCLSLSNLGAVKLPQAMVPYVKRMDFILGVQSTGGYNCGVLSLGETLYLNFIRDIEESGLEYHFFRVLREQGIPVMVESNGP